MKCVYNISLEKDTKCLKKCSGILVTDFDKHKMSKKSMKFISKLSNIYWNYKGFYDLPGVFRSM